MTYMPYAVLFLFFIVAWLITREIKPTYDTMTTANHSVPWFVMGLSIMVTFAVPAALLQAGGFTYKLGISGLAVYVAAYVSIYIAYAFFIARIKQDHPTSLTLSDVLHTGIGRHTGLILRWQYTIGPIYGILLNFTGMKIITEMWGFSTLHTYVFMVLSMLAVLIYCWKGGIASSIKTDLLQAACLIGSSILIFVAVMPESDLSRLIVSWQIPFTFDLLLNPGLLFVFLLGGSIFSDIELFNRTNAIKHYSQIKYACFTAATVAAIIMISYGILGGMAEPGLSNADQSVVQVITNQGLIIQIIFIMAVLALLISNLDSAVVANGIIFTHEWLQKHDIRWFRIAMIFSGIIGVGLTFLDLPILTIIMIWTCYRLSTLPAVIAFAFKIKYDDIVWACSFLAAITIGSTIVFLSFYKNLGVNVTMMGYTTMLIISSLGVYVGSRIKIR